MTQTEFSLKDALLDPSRHYAAPKDAAQDAQFSITERREILQAWQSNEEALQRAANEGLDGGERSHLQLVIKELSRLEEGPDR